MLLSALLPSGIKSVYLLPVKFHHRGRNVLVITSWKPIGKWFSWRGACVLVPSRIVALPLCLPWPCRRFCPKVCPFYRLLPSRDRVPSSLGLYHFARSLERRNGIYRAVNATFQRFIIGPIHSLIHRFDRGAPLVNGPYDIMYIACCPTPSCPFAALEPSLISVMTDNFPPYTGSAALNSILISGISSFLQTHG